MTLKEYYKKYDRQINKKIAEALREDKAADDITTGLILKGNAVDKKQKAVLLCKQDCILSGLEIFKKVYRKIDPKIKFQSFYKDGNHVRNKTKVMIVEASLRNLLIGERVALNFLQIMSGIATLTNRFVKKLKYKGARILHTRKTTPNFRVFEIAAVKIGGGDFHRIDLSSAVMIKDNHIEAVGNINDVMSSLNKVRNKLRKNNKLMHRFEIEVKNLREIEAVIKHGKGIVKIVMLDNFKPAEISEALQIIDGNFETEASGGITINNIEAYAQTGVHYISVGALIHQAASLDLSLKAVLT